MSRLIDADLLKKNCKCTGGFEDNFKCVSLSELAKVIDAQPSAKMKDVQDDIANIIYGTLDHMYCDNCRFNSEIKESDSDEWNCDECHRKFNGWGVSMQESNRIAKEILKQLGE
jgi:ribosomal protein L37AE/L43A